MFHTLTPRRLETLATLRRLTEEAGSAVHYSLVAARMRISAWTAYDLLLELEKLGLVVRRSVQGGGAPHGRPLPDPLCPLRRGGDLGRWLRRLAGGSVRALLGDPGRGLRRPRLP